MKRPQRPLLSLKARALRYLSQREHSALELERKLAAYAKTPEELSAVLAELQAQNWQSDERYALARVRTRAAKYGSLRLRQDLENVGIDTEKIAQALENLDESELARAQAVWRKKFGQVAAYPENLKQMNFLARRGFSSETIKLLMKNIAEGASISKLHDS